MIRDAFRAAGHDAWSCDLEPASGKHLQGDIIKLLNDFDSIWDLIILHPDCTALTVAGNHVYAEGKAKHHLRLAAIEWTEKLWHLATSKCQLVALENPLGVLSTKSNIGKAHYIQPYDFGEDASKKTGWWLHNLPKLKPTKRFDGRIVVYNGKQVERWGNQCDSGQNKLGPSEHRAMDRAKTYPGIANAIVDQWGQARSRVVI